MSGDGILDVAVVNTETFSFDNELLDLVLEEIGFFGSGGSREGGDNGSRTCTDFEKTGIDEASDDLVSRVGIDFQFAAEGADGRKIVTGTQLTRDDGLCGCVDDLLVKRGAGSEVNVERDHGVYHDR